MFKNLGLYMVTFIIITVTNIAVLGVSEYNMEKQAIEDFQGREELTELTIESLDKINDYYDLKEYDTFKYLYNDDKLEGITYKVENFIGKEHWISFGINNDKEPTLEEIESEIALFEEEVRLCVKHSKYLSWVEGDETPNKSMVGIRLVAMSGIIAFVPFVVAEKMHM